jgi:hypothetical protein
MIHFASYTLVVLFFSEIVFHLSVWIIYIEWGLLTIILLRGVKFSNMPLS